MSTANRQYQLCLNFCFLMAVILCFVSCRKANNPNPNNNNSGSGIKGFLRQYRWYNAPGITPDSVVVDIDYDTIGRSITLKQDFTGDGSLVSWKYQYDASGYLTSVHDITQGEAAKQLIDSFTYDANKDVSTCLTYENKIIPYATTLSGSGKQIIMYDTAYSGYLGGSVFGQATILYNLQNQLTDRMLHYGANTQTTALVDEHEMFSYDASGNINQYTFSETNAFTDANGNPDSWSATSTENYTQRDDKGNELYLFDNILLKGVVNLLGGNALIDPLGNTIGTSKTFYFQSQKSALLQGGFENGYNFSGQPEYDSLGRLTRTSGYDSQSPGVVTVTLLYY